MTMTDKNNYQGRVSGFSLLELLLSVALMVSISATVMLIVFQSNKTEKTTDTIIKNRQEKRLIQQLLEHDFNAVVFLPNVEKKSDSAGLLGRNINDLGTKINQIYLHVHQPSLSSQIFDSRADPLLHEVYYVTIKNFGQDDFYSLYRGERFFIGPNFSLIDNAPDPYQFNEPEFEFSLVHPKIISTQINYIAGTTQTQPSKPLESWRSADYQDEHKLPLAIIVKIKFASETGDEIELNFQHNLRPPLAGTVWGF